MFHKSSAWRLPGGWVALFATVWLSPVGLRAQNAPGPTSTTDQSEGGSLQQLVVTGSLIPHIGEATQPVSNFDQNYIGKRASQSAGEVLQGLPAAVGNFAPNQTTGFGFSPAASSIGLKGLPPNATLVLIDGLRFPLSPFPQQSTAGAISFVDLNAIPSAAIDRIEILDDGGSATYGTDAVAGVVNVILKDEYNGADVYNYFGISQRGDDETYHSSFTGGISQKLGEHSKFSILAAFDYYSSGPINVQDRARTRLDSQVYSPRYPGNTTFPNYRGGFTDPAGNFYQVNPGSVPPITAANFTVNGPDDFEYNNSYYQILPRESKIGGLVKLNFQVTDWLKIYDGLVINVAKETGTYQNEGVYSPSPFNSGGVIVPANNPNNPFGVPLADQGQALGEFGPLREEASITTFRNVVGATIQLPHGWFIDGSFLYGESDGTYNQLNNFTTSGLNAALAGTFPGKPGVFFNPFVDEGVAGANAAFYNSKLVANIFQDNRTDLVQWDIHAGGTLLELPTGNLQIAGGYQYRSEGFFQHEDDNSKFGNVTDYQNTVGVLTNARRYINSFFGEIDIPILGGKLSVPGMRLLDAIISDRYDDYSDFGSAAKPKFALRYKPLEDLTFRASYAEGFIAPSLSQLFGSPLPAETGVVDPVPANGAYTAISRVFGNPSIKPQTSYGYFASALWSPGSADPDKSPVGFLNGFSAYVKWYEINQHNLIGTLTPQEIVDLGASAPAGNSFTRNGSGLIDTVTGTYLNLGNNRTDGIETGFNYTTKEFAWGKLDLELDANIIYSRSRKQITGLNPDGTLHFTVENTTDTFGLPDLKLLASIFYSKTLFGIDTLRTGVTLHFVDSEDDVRSSLGGTDPNFNSDVAGTSYTHKIGNWTTFDYQLSYTLGAPATVTPETPKPGYDKEGKKIVGEKAVTPKPEGSSKGIRNWIANTTLTFGINNVFDARPPLSADWYQTYDQNVANYIQRYFYVSIEKKF